MRGLEDKPLEWGTWGDQRPQASREQSRPLRLPEPLLYLSTDREELQPATFLQQRAQLELL